MNSIPRVKRRSSRKLYFEIYVNVFVHIVISKLLSTIYKLEAKLLFLVAAAQTPNDLLVQAS
jgi:hypothetical protein